MQTSPRSFPLGFGGPNSERQAGEPREQENKRLESQLNTMS